ncbi:hypothetical protein Desru_2893 [Desulforamulus ruminis DSM 2154]|uniref:Uncharacterized protein n=1 Tax=Desulforamulus ruminis (strain ATCC 23193 / DSM 2154 / NCIMB 8452 / DL) TaxID=696281 RepID=F6DSL7_DESRL|nr:hypothetical protein Desru_2893 [Desulforamulus ruminis DSM 2154]
MGYGFGGCGGYDSCAFIIFLILILLLLGSCGCGSYSVEK